MKILIVSQYFYPENFRINDLAEYFYEKENEVSVLTGYPNYPAGKIYEGYTLFKNKFEIYNGINIHRVPIVPRGKSRIKLIVNFFSFFISASIYSFYLRKQKFDIILVYEPSPITVMIPAILLKKIMKIPLYFWMLDLWPDSLIATNATSNKFIISSLDRLVTYFYSQSDKILISSLYFENHILNRKGNKEQIYYLPNWADKELEESAKVKNLGFSFNLPSGFVIMFAGNIGESQDFGTLIKVAQNLKPNNDIHFVIVGDGRKLNWLKDEIIDKNLTKTFHFFGSVEINKVIPLLFKADVLYLSLKNSLIFESTVPGKFQTYLLAGKPIISAVNGETYELIKQSGVGIPCHSGNVGEITEAILKLKNMSDLERKEMGGLGQKLYWEKYNRTKSLNELIKNMELSIIEKKR